MPSDPVFLNWVNFIKKIVNHHLFYTFNEIKSLSTKTTAMKPADKLVADTFLSNTVVSMLHKVLSDSHTLEDSLNMARMVFA